MAVVLGTNAGFVTVAPTGDPLSTSFGTDSVARAHKHTMPAGMSKITEIGWFKSNIKTSVNYQLCLYSHDSGSDVPDALLFATDQALAATAAGWVIQTVDWDVIAGTVYWLAVQVDNVSGSADIDYNAVGNRDSIDTALASPSDPWVSADTSTRILAIYGLVEAGVIDEGTKTVTVTAVVSLVSDTVAIAEGTKIVTVAATVSLALESFASKQGPVPGRPSDYNANLYWDEENGVWNNTRTTHPGNWVQRMVTISEEGEIYFRTV